MLVGVRFIVVKTFIGMFLACFRSISLLCSEVRIYSFKNAVMKYPIGIQDFEQIIQNGYVYVDKTQLLYRLVTEGKI